MTFSKTWRKLLRKRDRKWKFQAETYIFVEKIIKTIKKNAPKIARPFEKLVFDVSGEFWRTFSGNFWKRDRENVDLGEIYNFKIFFL